MSFSHSGDSCMFLNIRLKEDQNASLQFCSNISFYNYEYGEVLSTMITQNCTYTFRALNNSKTVFMSWMGEVPSKSNPSLFYIVNTEIGACIYPVGISGGPCKHQGVVAINFHIATLNFIPSLTPND
ncbi:5979_t:CDS:2 [Funneliformis mosseae]|uniref:5979_t:CDS:1 n=1 Tax=Funneliformis mosseae TaxID=27381 RepID=A0A9N9DGT0_FUNMO|nr:5979_t:CDS:2 [Funneliformis mosseae]